MATVNHGIRHLLHGNQFLGHQLRPDVADFVLSLQKQALKLPEQHPAWPQRGKNQVDGQPVGDKTDGKATHRQHPRLRIGYPKWHQQSAQQGTDQRTPVDHRLQFHGTGLFENAVHQVRMVLQFAAQQRFQVYQVVQVVTKVFHQLLYARWQLLSRPLVNAPFHKHRQVVPKHRLHFVHHFIDVFVHARRYLGQNLLDNALGFELLVHRVEVAEMLQGAVDADVGHFLGFAGNHALPANDAETDELNRIERHLNSQPVSKPANYGSHHWHG